MRPSTSQVSNNNYCVISGNDKITMAPATCLRGKPRCATTSSIDCIYGTKYIRSCLAPCPIIISEHNTSPIESNKSSGTVDIAGRGCVSRGKRAGNISNPQFSG